MNIEDDDAVFNFVLEDDLELARLILGAGLKIELLD